MAITSSAELSALLDKLSSFQAPAGTGVVSAYLDNRRQSSGERPGRRAAEVVLKDRLGEIEQSLLPRGAGLESFREDRKRIEEAFAGASPAAEGLCVFACTAGGIFEAVEIGAAVENRVIYDNYPALYQLARLADEYESAVVALADSNTLRVFVLWLGNVEEAGGTSEDSVSFRKRRTGGLNQERYQRHIEKHRTDFASEAAEVITSIVDEEGARQLVLAGDEVIIPNLRDALPERIRGVLVGDALRIDIRAGRDAVKGEVSDLLEQVELRRSRDAADAVLAEVRKDGLGVAGTDPVREALSAGQADTLVIVEGFESAEARNELTRLALATSATVEVVASHPGLERLGGVGAILRYRV